MNLRQIVPITAIIVFFSFGSIWLSNYIMREHQDCRLDEPYFNHTIPSTPLPNNCASGTRMLTQALLQYIAIALILLPIFLPFFINWRQQRLGKDENDLIRITEYKDGFY